MKKVISLVLTVLFFSQALSGCSTEEEPKIDSYDYIAMDTVFSIQAGPLAADSEKSKDEIFKSCEEISENIEMSISKDLEGSDLYSLNTKIDALFDADPILTEVLTLALDISEKTGGAFDPTLGALTTLWNVKGGGPVPAQTDIDASLKLCGTELIEIKDDAIHKNDADMMIDLGGIGKGYAAQKLVEHLYSSGFSYGIISAGRTVGVFGEKPDGNKFKIGIADPFDPDGIVGYLYTDSGFVSVAGDYEQYFEENGIRYHHIIDPESGYPSDSGLTSVAVFSQNGATADALSTALMIMGYERGMEFYKSSELSFEAVFICDNGSVKTTDGLTTERFEMNKDYNPIITTNTTSSVPVTSHQTEVSKDPETTSGEVSSEASA